MNTSKEYNVTSEVKIEIKSSDRKKIKSFEFLLEKTSPFVRGLLMVSERANADMGTRAFMCSTLRKGR